MGTGIGSGLAFWGSVFKAQEATRWKWVNMLAQGTARSGELIGRKGILTIMAKDDFCCLPRESWFFDRSKKLAPLIGGMTAKALEIQFPLMVF